ncbi:MAG: hypothetical protein ACLPTZ_23995 [Beijerinckiaceae bacterium]
MTRSSADNLIHLDAAIKRRSARPMTERERSREWVGRLRREIRAGHLDAAAVEHKVKLASVLAVAKSLASPRYPSFWGAGVYAKQATIGADPDVGLSGDHVARVIKLLAKTGYLDRADQDERKGRTCLLRPKLPAAALDAPAPPTPCRTTPDTMSDHLRHHVGGTSDTMSDESTNLIPNQKADPTLAEPSGHAANCQANKGNNDSASSPSESAETAEPATSEVLQSCSFEVFWHRSVEPRGHLGFALAEWRKLTVDQQRLACEHPARDAWAGVWLRDHGFDLEPTACTELAPYSPEWDAERERRIAGGLGLTFMDAQAREGKGWTVKGSPP